MANSRTSSSLCVSVMNALISLALFFLCGVHLCQPSMRILF